MKIISLIVPCYNVSEYLDRCWESIEKQTIGLEKLECIFVNDMSDDDGKTWSKLLEIEHRAPDSVVIIDMNDKGGPGGCRNEGLKYVSGKYLEFLDADDELIPEACEVLCSIADKTGVDVIQFNHFHVINDNYITVKNCNNSEFILLENELDRAPFLCSGRVTFGVWNKLYRMDLVKKINPVFPLLLRYEEPLFVFPVFLYAQKVYLLDRELYVYYRRPNSIITSEVGKRILDHPNVQMMLLEDIMKRGEIFEQNFDAIELYFLWSFYCETLLFASQNREAFLPLDFFWQMQKVCKNFFGNWRNNKFISKDNNKAWIILETIDRKVESQEELNEIIAYANKVLN